MKTVCSFLIVIAACALALLSFAASAEWPQALSYDNDSYWNARVSVKIENPTDKRIQGAPVRITVQNDGPTAQLLGTPAAAIRVVSESDVEYVHAVRTADGIAKSDGAIAAGDLIEFPAEVKSSSTALAYIYAGNAKAWAPPDTLQGILVNTSFEQGGEQPTGWSPNQNDASHRVFYDHASAHTGKACVGCEVDAGAPPTWVQYGQSGIVVLPGQKLRFAAWVRGENVAGKAGWYVHVSGDQQLLVNRVEGFDGTFDWRQLVIEFDVPEGARTFTCGTVLNGTGKAWYDDVTLEPIGGTAGPTVTVVNAEKKDLAVVGADCPWPNDTAWAWRVPLCVRNFSDQALTQSVVGFDTRRVYNRVAKLVGFTTKPRMRVVEADIAEPLRFTGTLDSQLQVVTDVPALSEKVLWLCVGDGTAPANETPYATLADWSASPLNLLANGSMENDEDARPDAWVPSEGAAQEGSGFTAKRVPGGVHGEYCLEFTVPTSIKEPGWNGWRQSASVKPSTRYLLAGYVKTQDTDGSVRIHGHFHKADGSLTESPFFGTGPDLQPGNNDWTLSSVVVTTPPDCASIMVHLTMNAHGTLYHDGLLLVETASGVAGEVEPREPQREPLTAWAVNPLVKVFREDVRPANAAAEVSMYATRNAYEACQVAVRALNPTQLKVAVTPFTGPNGVTLDAPTVYQVGYVPIDFPIGYHSTTEPDYHRFMPTNRSNDGWAGYWPDPLMPLGDGMTDIAASETQPFWFDAHIPADAAPGEYHAEATFTAGETSMRVPITLTVWDFVQPDDKHVTAIYDLRGGPGMSPFKEDDAVRTWLRFLARYNVSPGILMPSPDFSYKDGVVSMNTEAFDATAEFLFDKLHGGAVYTPHLFYACGWAYLPQEIFGLPRFSPEYTKAWTDAYRLFIDHVTQKGWRNKFVHYLSDEPFESSKETIDALNKVADMAKSVAPDVPVYSSTWRYIDGLAGHLTMWGIGPHGSFDEQKRIERKAAGDRFWFTTDGQMCTDTPYLGIERLLPWFCLKYDVEAYEFWGVSWWTYDPWQYGWHQYIRQSDDGKKYYHVRYPNGDGFLAYPPANQGQSPGAGTVPDLPVPDLPNPTEPLPSMRLVAAREGVDDYELFFALKQFADNGNTDAQTALDRVRALVNMPNPGGRYSTAVMPDPDAVAAARVEAGKALNALRTVSK